MQGRPDRWLFIRNADPDRHRRVRFHGAPQALRRDRRQSALRPAVAPLVEAGRLWRVTLDTCEREVERYGGADGIRLAEQLFHADSDATLAILDALDPGDTGLDQRWRLALRGMHALLADFALELRARVALLRELRDAPGGEMQIERAQKRQLGDTYRNERTGLAGSWLRRSTRATRSRPGSRRCAAGRSASARSSPASAPARRPAA